MQYKIIASVMLAIGCAMLTACSPTIRQPRLFGPGPAPFQQYNATQFDPYPPNDLGPEIVGGRPKDFQKPYNEVERARQHTDQSRWNLGPLY